MSPGRVAALAAGLAVLAALGGALAAGAPGAMGVLGGAGVALGTFGWTGMRLGSAARRLAGPGAASPGAMTASLLALTGIRWTLAGILLWGLLGHAQPLAVVAGLSCMPAAIWLLSLLALLRAPHEPSAGAPP